MTQNKTRKFRHAATLCLFGGIGVAGVTLVCSRLHVNLATPAFFYLIVVVLISLRDSLVSSLVVSLVAIACLNYFFAPPISNWRADYPLDIAVVPAFALTSVVITTLISTRRRAFQEAQSLKDQLRRIIDTIPVLVASTRPDGAVDFVNRRWREYLGLALEDVRGWDWRSALHPDDSARFTDAWTAALATGTPLESEARMRRADGEYRWFLHRAVPLRDEGGDIVKWYGTSTDIEDRKRAEVILREQARLLDLTHDTIFVRDRNDVITYWNRGAEQLYGWTSEEAVGKVSHQLMRTSFPAPLEQITATLLGTGRWEGELIHTRRNGTQVTVASRWSMQQDERGRPVGTLETNNDITERKQAEDALRRSEAYLAEAQRLSQTGSWAQSLLHPQDGYWSAEGYRIFGLDPARGPLTPRELRDLVHREDAPRVEALAQQAIREKTDFEAECRAVLPDGSTRYIRAVGHPVVNASGDVVELVGTVMDVTERKRAERAVRRARDRALEARFAAVLEERTRLARELHDTLLQGFTGVALQLVAATGRVSGPPEAVAALHDVITLAQRTLTDARQAVWDLRAPTLAGGDFPTSLRLTAEEAVRGAGLVLAYEVEGTPRLLAPEVEAVVVRVAQEALANVVKHAGARRARLRLIFKPRSVRLSVVDDGRGFAVDPDFRAYGGHWGLLGMKERATQLNGTLTVQSAPGHGTEIVLRVPYAFPGGELPVSPAS